VNAAATAIGGNKNIMYRATCAAPVMNV